MTKLIDSNIISEAADRHTLERMIDRYTLSTVLETVALICSEKADHIRENWQDERTAGAWDKACERAMRAAIHTSTVS